MVLRSRDIDADVDLHRPEGTRHAKGIRNAVAAARASTPQRHPGGPGIGIPTSGGAWHFHSTYLRVPAHPGGPWGLASLGYPGRRSRDVECRRRCWFLTCSFLTGLAHSPGCGTHDTYLSQLAMALMGLEPHAYATSTGMRHDLKVPGRNSSGVFPTSPSKCSLYM